VSGNESEEYESEGSARPFGARPFGARPFGARGSGERPFGARPFGARPFGARGSGERPFGARPFGARPFGARPFGARAVDGSEECEDWGAALAEMVCARSAVIRMGGLLVAGRELRVPVFDPSVGFRDPGTAGPAAGGTVDTHQPLRPGDWTLEAAVEVPYRLVEHLAGRGELAESFLVDLAETLTEAVDGACLGTAASGPQGISALVPRTGPAAGGAEPLARLRDVVKAVRGAHPVRNPGWILHPDALDSLARFQTRDGEKQDAVAGRTVDATQLLHLDGADGGTLLGYPFLTSRAARQGNRDRVYFSVDWQEAWLGVESWVVDLVATGEPAPSAESLVIRAVMPLDVGVRRGAAFAWTVV